MIHNLPKGAAALALALPSQTHFPDEHITSSNEGRSPKPTQGPLDNLLIKRQTDSRTCGYIDAISSMFLLFSYVDKGNALKVIHNH